MRDFFVNVGDFFVRLFTDLFNIDRWYLDIIDIALVAVILYYIIKFVRETRAAQLVKAIMIFFIVFLVSSLLDLTTISFLLEYVFQYGLVAIAIIFQPEIRRGLEKIGRSNFRLFSVISKQSQDDTNSKWKYAIDPICEACYRLSSEKTGALIVMERETKLGDVIKTGTLINAEASSALLENIFVPNTPLHDGAVVIRDNKVEMATCVLPLSQNPDIRKELGTRHRAGIGISEESDAVVVIVSEETGNISVAYRGMLNTGFGEETLRVRIMELLSTSFTAEPTSNTKFELKNLVKRRKQDEKDV